MAIKISSEKCTLCLVCVNTCPFGALELRDEKIVVNDSCTLCGSCKEACLGNVITLEETQKTLVNGDYKGIWVFAEQRAGNVKSVALELLAKARELASGLKSEVNAVCFGHDVQNLQELIRHGADKVFLIDSPELASNPEDYLTAQLSSLIQHYKPEIVLAGATALGRSFIPRVAAKIQSGLTADCTGLEIDVEKRQLLQTRPTFGGNIMATIICPSSRPQMATVRPHTFKKNAPDTRHPGQIIKLDFIKEGVTARSQLIEFVEDVSEKVKLDEAEVIIAGGRGLGKPENFHLIAEFAAAMGAALGSSRPPVDEGWIPYSHQVGQTGKTVAPKVYIACGISGAVQHLAGMQTANTIIAINSDASAPIFDVATYGLVGDLFKIVPLLIQKLKRD